MTETRKVVFIGGSAYSGSTMLDMMLSNHPAGFSVGEVNALFQPFRPHHFKPQCGCGLAACNLWQEVRQAGMDRLYSKVFELHPQVKFIVDSSKAPFWIEKQARSAAAQGYEVHHLLIWKPAAAFAHSMLKRGEDNWARNWKSYYRLYYALFPQHHSVSYEALAADPAGSLEALCRLLGLAYQEGQEQFWGKQHHTLFGNDSAKIHLFDGNSAGYSSHEQELVEADSAKHRNIYQDKSYQQALPAEVSDLLRSDPEVQLISSLLEQAAPDPQKLAEAAFAKQRVLAGRLVAHLRNLAGRLLGRYVRVY